MGAKKDYKDNKVIQSLIISEQQIKEGRVQDARESLKSVREKYGYNIITTDKTDELNTIGNDFQHKTLEQRYKEFDGEISSLEEHNFGEPVGREIW